MQRHYDTMSQSAITGMAVVAAGTPALYKSLGLPAAGLVFLAAIPLLNMAMKIYESCDVHAAYALKVAGLYEEFDTPHAKPVVNGMTFHGPAQGFTERQLYGLEGRAGGSIHSTVKRLFRGVIVLFLILGSYSLYSDLGGAALLHSKASKADVKNGSAPKSRPDAKSGS